MGRSYNTPKSTAIYATTGNDENGQDAEKYNMNLREQVITDVAEFVFEYPDKVMDALGKTGFYVPAGVTDEQLACIVSRAIFKSKKFARLLITAMANTTINGDHNTMGPDTAPTGAYAAPKASWGERFQKWMPTITEGIKTIGTIWGQQYNSGSPTGGGGGYTPSESTNQQTGNDFLEKILLMKSMSGNNTGLYIGLGVAGLLVVGLVVFLAMKK